MWSCKEGYRRSVFCCNRNVSCCWRYLKDWVIDWISGRFKGIYIYISVLFI